jgi:hypothetical protein
VSQIDETGNAEDALEGGLEFNNPPPDPQTPTETNEERAKRAARQRRANREQLIDAVADLSEAVAEKAAGDGLRCIDLLRLRRAMLMILASAAWSARHPRKMPSRFSPRRAMWKGLGRASWARPCLLISAGGGAPSRLAGNVPCLVGVV